MEMILTVNGVPYEIKKLLGHGKGGYSYLAQRGGAEYVLKQIHHEPCSYYEFGNKMESELRDYHCLKEIGIPLPALLVADMENERILKEYIAGDTIYDLILRDEMRPEYVEQLVAMCQLLYPAGTNIDYFPTNFVVRNGQLLYIDFECNPYEEQWDFEHWGNDYWWRSPAFLEYAEKMKP